MATQLIAPPRRRGRQGALRLLLRTSDGKVADTGRVLPLVHGVEYVLGRVDKLGHDDTIDDDTIVARLLVLKSHATPKDATAAEVDAAVVRWCVVAGVPQCAPRARVCGTPT